MTRTKPLACGGKGPCCHIGYAHRHCEHCDVVIATAPVYVYPWIYPSTIRPYQPYWGTAIGGSQIGNNFGNVGNAQGFAQALESSWKNAAAAADPSPTFVRALPEPTAAHLCEVK